MDAKPRPLGAVLATGALTGLIAATAAGMIDAVWSWAPAAQFVPHAGGRLRFVLYTALSHGAGGAVIGAAALAIGVALARGTRLGNLVRFAFADHEARRARDPRVTVVGLALVLAGLPALAASLWVGFRLVGPYVTNRHAIALVVVVAMAATLAAVAVAVVAAFVLGRLVELALRPLAARVRWVSSVWAPFVAAGALVALAAAAWAIREWETARILPLRGPLVIVLAAIFAIPARRPARRVAELAGVFRPVIRRTAGAAVAVV